MTVEMNQDQVSIEAIGDKIVVAPEEPEERSAAGIIIPEDARKPSQRAEVIAVGEKVETLSPGAIVHVAKYAGTELKIGDRDLLVIREDDVLVREVETVVD
jgi:chaperonin GroES